MLTLGVYVEYVRGPFSPRRYLLLITAFGLGLMAKPMLVTLPLVLLLLDYWPLGRFPFRWQLVMEKVPLLLLSAISCMVTLSAQREALALNAPLATSSRAANALVSYVAYLGQFCWPVGLAVCYPHPAARLPIWKPSRGTGAVGVHFRGGAGRPAAAPLRARRLAVVRGDAGAGDRAAASRGAARADRYMYLPQIGLCLALTWGAAEVCRSWSRSSLARWR